MRTLWATVSCISSLEVSGCLVEFVDEEVYCAGTISWVSINRCWAFSSKKEF